MKKSLLLTALLAIGATAAAQESSQSSFIAQELDGKKITIANARYPNSHIAVVNNQLKSSTTTNTAEYTWTVEYDATEDGMILSCGSKYIGRMPTTRGAAFTLTTTKDDAGRFRFYSIGSNYGLTCTQLTNGTRNETIGTTGTVSDTGADLWANGSGDNKDVTRWASGHDASKWTYAEVEDVDPATIYTFAPLATTDWENKLIAIKGEAANNIDRYMFDEGAANGNLQVQRNHDALDKYWIAERDENYGGVYLKNAITGRYIGMIGQNNNTPIPMTTNKGGSAGIIMVYPRENTLFITTTRIYEKDVENSIINNPLLCHVDGEKKGYADFTSSNANIDNSTKLWMFCTNGNSTDTEAYNVLNFGNGNANGHWAVETTDDAALLTSVLTAAAKYNAKKNFPDMTDEEINTWVAEIMSGLDSSLEFSAKYAAVIGNTNFLAKQLDGKTFIIGNADITKAANGYRLAIVNNALQLSNVTDKTATAWTATYIPEEDGVKLSIGDRYIGRMPAISQAFTLTDVENAGCYRFYRSDNDFALTCTRLADNGEKVNPIGKLGAGGDNTANFWMQGPDNNGNVKRWGSGATTSHWMLAFVEEREESATPISVGITFDNSSHVITFAHTDGLSKHDPLLYDNSHVITITKTDPTETEEPSARTSEIVKQITHSDITAGENGLTSTISDPYLEPGQYKLDVPAGMFKVGSNMDSKAHTLNFSVNSDHTTGIAEVEAAEAAGHVIYDLQGRRLAAPAKGINIINGRKVLVK